MSAGSRLKAEGELKAQIDALLKRAKTADAAEAEEPEVDIPAEIERREVRLKAIVEARQRIEKRQRDANIERGRSPDDQCKSTDEDGKPTGGRFKREFGQPEPTAQENFTDPDSRIMKRAGGGFDAGYDAQTAVDERARIIVAAELSDYAAGVGQLVPMLGAVKTNTGRDPRQALASTGRCGLRQRAELPSAGPITDRVGGGHGRRGQALRRDRRREEPAHGRDGRDGRQATDRRRQGSVQKAQMDRRAAQRVDQERVRTPPIQPARTAPRASRVQARVHGAELEAHRCNAGGVKVKR